MIRQWTALVCAVGAVGTAAAQTLSPTPTPGLWETQTKMLINGQDFGATIRKAQEDMLKSVPPEQRKQMADMMRQHGGGGGMGGPEMQCITAEEVAKMADLKAAFAEMRKEQPQCQFEPLKVSGSSASFKVRCKDPEGFSGEGQGEIKIQSAKSTTWRYEGTGRMNGMQALPGMKPSAGGPDLVKFQMESSSRWVSASCGNVKP